MLKIQTWNENEILRQISESIKPNEFNTYIKLWKEMIKYIKNKENNWVWLAAPQVWYNKRLIVISLLKTWDDENFQTILMLNPKIIEYSNECDILEEWCLSLPWKKWNVERYKNIKIEFIDDKKTKKVMLLSWISSRIFQHEIDHLNWILFTDKILKN